MNYETNNHGATRPGAQFAPPHADARIGPASTAATPLDSGPSKRPGSSRRAIFAIVGVAIVALAGVSVWLATRDGGSSTAPAQWPQNPQLRRSFEATMTDDDFPGAPDVSGTVHDLYIGESGADSSTVTRYVDGEPRWEAQVGEADLWFIHDWDGKILVSTSGPEVEDDSELVRINPDDGSTIWSIRTSWAGSPIEIDGRLYVMDYGLYFDDTDELAEFDFESGEELKRITDAKFFTDENGFIKVDVDASTAQRIDPDFEPVGDPVKIEASGDNSYPWIVEPTTDGLIYLAGDRAVGLSWQGDTTFECDVSIDEADSIYLEDESTLIVTSIDSVEVFNIDGSSCTALWSRAGNDDTSVSPYAGYVEFTTYEVAGDYIDYRNDPSVVELLDLKTGDVVTTGEGEVWLDGDRTKIATMDGDSIVARELDGGAELWRIDIAEGADFRFLDRAVVVTTVDGSTATIDIYAD